MPNRIALNHLYWRAGFGPTPAQLALPESTTLDTAYGELLTASEQPFKSQLFTEGEFVLADRKNEAFWQRNRELIIDGNAQTLRQLVTGGQLREKLVFLWQDHFACSSPLFPFTEHYYNTLQTHALGSFRDLLHGVAKAPAMLQFLNNQQNRKSAPNENFAREVMELFTLGRGHYTEQDIKEAARAFTGWSFDHAGKYLFRSWTHDSGSKTFRGKTGNFTGEDILHLLLEDRQTARYITWKLYRFFVNENVPDNHLEQLSKQFYESDYAIEPLVRTLLTAEWANHPDNRGHRIKSPIELLAGLLRAFSGTFEESKPAIGIQRILGQTLLHPPSVNGWPEGREWIDGAGLLTRLRLGEVMLLAGELGVQAREGGDAEDPTGGQMLLRSMPGRDLGRLQGMANRLQAKTDFEPFARVFANLRGERLLEALADSLLQVPLTDASRKVIHERAENLPAAWQGRSETFVYTLLLVGLPEYQLC